MSPRPRTLELHARLARHLAAGAIAVAAHAALVEHADAAVIYSAVNWTVPSTVSGLYINVESRTTGTLDTDVPGWDLNPYSATSLAWFNAVGTGMMRFPGVTTGAPGCLAAGTTVGPTGSFGSGTVVVGTAPGNWHLNSANYFGFRFVGSDGLTHYGWGKFEIGSAIAGADRRITEIAWDSVANRAIVVGDTGAPPPGYDPCASTNPAAAVGANSLALNQTAAADLAVPSCGFTIRKANYFKFIAPLAGTYTVSTCGVAADTRLAVLAGCAAGSTVLACNDDACGTGSRLSFTAATGGVYYIAVGGNSADLPSPIALQVDPPWSTCAAPTVASLGANPFTCYAFAPNQIASAGVAAGVNRTLYNTAWFVFTPPVTARYRFSTCGSAGNTQMAVAQACAASATTALATLAFDDDGCACADGSCSGLPWASVIDETALTDKPLANPLTAGVSYLIAIGGFSASDLPSGALNIEDTSSGYNPCSPLNPTAAEGANLLAISQAGAADRDLGSCGIASRANLFKFTATFSGEYTIATCGSGVDTALAVLDGCGVSAGVLACARNNCGQQESLAFTASAGATYYILVGSGAASVSLPAQLPLVVTTPPDASCTSATALSVGAQPFGNASSSLVRAVKSSADGDATAIYKAVYYTFTPGVTGAYGFSLCGSTGDSQLAIGLACATLGNRFESIAYNDDACGALSVIDATNGGSAGTAFGGFPLTQQLLAGEAYRLVVGSFDPNEAIAGTLVVSGPPQGNPADLNHDGVVNASDIAILLGNWGGAGEGDIDHDGLVGAQDLAALLGAWG